MIYEKLNKKTAQIIELYNQGLLLNEIASATTSSTISIKKILLKNGIDYTSIKQKDYENRLNNVLKLYNEGKSQTFIEQELHLTRKTIRELLKKTGVNYRNRAEQHYIRCNTEINHNAFDVLTPDVLYWIGILYADGHIEKNCENGIELTLHTNDIKHLEKLKSFLQSNRPIVKGNGNCMRLRFHSKQIKEKLQSLGFTHNKSTTIEPHDLLKDSKDFWRGCVDGDGGVYCKDEKSYNCHQTMLCGTKATLVEYTNFVNRHANVKLKTPTKNLGKNLYSVSYYGEDCKKVINLLYNDASMYLERKYEKYQKIINN